MEARAVLQFKIQPGMQPRYNYKHNIKRVLPSIQASVPHDKTQLKSSGNTTSTYHDSSFDLMVINHISNNIQAITGRKSQAEGYEGFLEATRTVSKNFSPVKQRDISLSALQNALPLPEPISYLFKNMLPESKMSRELYAGFTTLLFTWLVGPSEVKEGEFRGTREKNIVHIRKCRFLEGSNCVGMCINLCKFPTQTFMKESLGMPVNMVPSKYTGTTAPPPGRLPHAHSDFEDMSCEMIFGEEPPAPNDDPVSQQPCYTECKIKKSHSNQKCSS